jgi:GAF domain
VSQAIRLAFAKREKRVSGAPRRARRASAAACPARREPNRPAPSFSTYEGLLAVTGLSKAMAGEATIEDVGALAWMILREVIPSESMAIFLGDEHGATLGVHYAAGMHADKLRAQRQAAGFGIAGWVFEQIKPAINIDPTPDFVPAPDHALRSSLAIPLIDDDWLVGVLVLYRKAANAYDAADLRLLELLAPRLASSVLDSAPADPRPAPPLAETPAPTLRLVKRS